MPRFSARPIHRRGLTLIELVVVIAILVVLGGLLVQNLPNMMKRNFSLIRAQHAPIPSTARQAWVLVPGTAHTALKTPHESAAIASFTMK